MGFGKSPNRSNLEPTFASHRRLLRAQKLVSAGRDLESLNSLDLYCFRLVLASLTYVRNLQCVLDRLRYNLVLTIEDWSR